MYRVIRASFLLLAKKFLIPYVFKLIRHQYKNKKCVENCWQISRRGESGGGMLACGMADGGKVIDDNVRSDNRFVRCCSVLISNIQTGGTHFFLFRFTLSGAISRALLHGSRHASPLPPPLAPLFSLYCWGRALTRPSYRPRRTAPHRAASYRAASRRAALASNAIVSDTDVTFYPSDVDAKHAAYLIRISISIICFYTSCSDLHLHKHYI